MNKVKYILLGYSWILLALMKTPADSVIKPDKSRILERANELLEDHGSYEIWNLSNVDTVGMWVAENHFTGLERETMLVWMPGSAGGSSGQLSNLLMLLDPQKNLEVIWAGQVGVIDSANVCDLNGDGILELQEMASSIWMGECHDSYRIFNLTGGRYKEVYKYHGYSVLSCGLEAPWENRNYGDTVIKSYMTSLYPAGNGWMIREIQVVGRYNGGNNLEDLMEQLATDTLKREWLLR